MSKRTKLVAAFGAVLVVVGAASVAVAFRPVFIEEAPKAVDDAPGNVIETQDDAANSRPTADDLPVRIGEPSPSLEAAGRSGLRPHEYPWFVNDAVPTPPDALASGSDLVAVLDRVPALDSFKRIEARGLEWPGEDLDDRAAILKVSENQLLIITTQRYLPEMTIPLDGRRTLEYAGGTAAVGSEPGQLSVILVTDGRMAILRLQATDAGYDEKLALSQDQLLAIAADIIKQQQ